MLRIYFNSYKKLKGFFSNAIPTGVEVRNDDIKITGVIIMSVDGRYIII